MWAIVAFVMRLKSRIELLLWNDSPERCILLESMPHPNASPQSMPMSSETELWRLYLRGDPTRFPLEADINPSVYQWYLIDLAHRPEGSVAVADARERVLYSPPVQDIFAAQQAEGYWATPDSLAKPYYHATLWNLALLAELGIPRDSRRARAAYEFALQIFLDEHGRFGGLDAVESGYLIHALAYFRPNLDERVTRAARALAQIAVEADSDEARVSALWAWADLCDDPEVSDTARNVRERLLDSLASRGDLGYAPITFPPFEPRDPLFISRVLALHNSANDPRAEPLIEGVLQKEDEWGRWPLEKNLNGSMTACTEEVTSASRWATLNALRVIVKLVKGAWGE